MNRLLLIRNLMLLAVVAVTCCAIPIAGQLSFDQSIESFFAPDNADILLLRKSRRDFGGDEFVIVAWKQPGLIVRDEDRAVPELSEEASTRIAALADDLNSIPGVQADQTRHLVRYLDRAPRSRLTREAMLRLFEGILIGVDEETTAIVLQILPESQSPVSRGETIREIRRVAHRFQADAAVAGEPVQIYDMFDLVERDGRLLYLASVAVLSLVLWVIFGSLRWVLSAIGIVVASVVCTRAVLVLSGARLSMVSSMLNSLVTVISVATTMHILVRYREHRRLLDVLSATALTIRELWQPVFWAILTTGVGFGSLLVSDIIPVRSFAVMMMAATAMILLFTFALIPAMLATGAKVPVPGRAPAESTLDQILNRLAHSIEHHPLVAALVCIALILGTAPGLFMLTVETDFSRNFRDSSPIVQSLKFVESNLGNAGTWEVAFDVPPELTAEFLDQARQLADRLQQLDEEGLELEILSLTDAIDIPPRRGNSKARLERFERSQPDLVHSMYNASTHRMRIVLRSREQQPAEAKLALIARVRSTVEQHFAELAESAAEPPTTNPPVQATASGLFVLLAHLIDSLLADQLNSFLVASFGILVCMTFAFRSLRIGLISLFPNIFPVILVIGAMGVLGIPINIGTAMIASVSMGLTVDSTIHYVTSFERARQTLSVGEALRVAHNGAGRGLVLAYLALMAGFLVLTVSAFIPLVYFGALISLSMIGGLVGNLVVLPLLLRWTTPVSVPPTTPTTE